MDHLTFDLLAAHPSTIVLVGFDPRANGRKRDSTNKPYMEWPVGINQYGWHGCIAGEGGLEDWISINGALSFGLFILYYFIGLGFLYCAQAWVAIKFMEVVGEVLALRRCSFAMRTS
jgi:hypothetical protein